MSDKIEILKNISQWLFDRMDHTDPDNENGIGVTAIEWAIDQLRWRKVEDEQPKDGQWCLVVPWDDELEEFHPGDVDSNLWNGEGWEFFPVAQWWRPIELPGG